MSVLYKHFGGSEHTDVFDTMPQHHFVEDLTTAESDEAAESG